jgi:hypothetical protein
VFTQKSQGDGLGFENVEPHANPKISWVTIGATKTRPSLLTEKNLEDVLR